LIGLVRLQLLDALQARLNEPLTVAKPDADSDSPEQWLTERASQALALIGHVRARWDWVLSHLDQRLCDLNDGLVTHGLEALLPAVAQRLSAQPDCTLFDIVQDRTL